ncbi:hypothetical protein UPYG_G00006690 [Umbra pygmaea]|uniref:Ig-like domain-containing protein n=1 Tax=Umbra pygmaea TaxID=75934 RepID=A0ABD0Y502_UMBPY
MIMRMIHSERLLQKMRFDIGFELCVMTILSLTKSHLIIQAECNEDISMMCEAIEDKTFKSITWYKVTLHNRTGIVRKSDNVKPQNYTFSRVAHFGEKNSLFLPNVRPEDAGTYQCLIRANVGQTNRESLVKLNVSTVCVIPTTTAKVEVYQNVTDINQVFVVDVSITWTSCGILIMVLVKFILCPITIKIFENIKKIHSSKKQQSW